MKQNQIKENLKLAGMKKTKGSLAVMSILMALKEPESAEEISEKLTVKIHIATLYRILDKLTEAGIIVRLNLNEQKSIYEYNRLPHHHFVCTNCNKVKDIYIDTKDIPIPTASIEKQYHIDIQDASMQFSGTCEDC